MPGTVLDVGNMKIINKTKFPSQGVRQTHAHIIIIRASGNTQISLKPRYVLICLEERGTELVREKGREEQLSDLKSLQTTGLLTKKFLITISGEMEDRQKLIFFKSTHIIYLLQHPKT